MGSVVVYNFFICVWCGGGGGGGGLEFIVCEIDLKSSIEIVDDHFHDIIGVFYPYLPIGREVLFIPGVIVVCVVSGACLNS